MALVPERVAGGRPGVTIDPTAIVHPGAEIGAGSVVGPHAIIGEHVRIGRDCRIGASSIVDGWTEIGDGNQIFPFASIGLIPQDLKFRGEKTTLVIGHRNVFREFVTIHRGTAGGGGSDRHRRQQRVHGLRARRARLPRRQLDDFRQRRDARRPRDRRGLRDDQRLFRRAPVLPGRPARVHRRLFGGDQGCAAVCEDRRQSRPDLRHQHDRPRAPEVLEGLDQPAAQAFRYLLHSNTSRALAQIDRDPSLGCAEVQYLLHFIRSSSRGVGLRRPSRRLEEVMEE